MKNSNQLKVLVSLLVMLFVQVVAFGQSSWLNRYTINHNNINYKFEVINEGSCYVVRFFGDSIKKDTISSIEDHAALKSLVFNIVRDGSKNIKKFNSDSAQYLASRLFEEYQNKQHTNILQSRIESLEHDKGANIGVISIKKAKAKVYLISRKKEDRKLFKLQKASLIKQDSLESSINSLKVSLQSIRKKKLGDTLDIFNKTAEEVNAFEKKIKAGSKFDHFYQLKRYFRKFEPSLIIDSIDVPIDSIDIAFENGVIKDILVRANYNKVPNSIKNAHQLFKGVNSYLSFSNLGYIPIRNGEAIDRHAKKGKNYLTCFYSDQNILVIDMADIIYFNRKIPFSSGTYIPKDTTIRLDNRKSKAVRLYKPPVLENLDIRLFTDALGYSGGQNPNGLVQIEAQLNLQLNQGRNRYLLFKIWKNSNDVKGKYRKQWVWLNRISPYMKFTKIEQNNKFLAIDTLSKKGDLLDVFKYSYFNTGTELNILSFRSDSKQFALNMAGGVLCTKVGNDSLRFGASNLSTLYMNPNIDFQFFDSNKLDFNLRFGCYGAWTITAIDSVDLANAKVSIKEYAFDKTHYWVQFQQSINIHPSGNKQRSIFLRSSQYLNMNKNFFTFQIGYSTTLSSLLKSTK